MKKVVVALLLGFISFPLFASDDTKDTIADIKASLGIMPTFLKAYPEVGLKGAWESWKGLEMNPQTAVDGKTKELIGLGVSAQIPCHYCSYAHSKFAQMNGATKAELQEAIAVAAAVREWSAIINGQSIPWAAFQKDVDDCLAYMKDTKHAAPKVMPGMSKTEEEITATLGRVPLFMQGASKAALPGAWQVFKTLVMNPKTALSPKAKDLISLGVAAQTPCPYCVYFHRATAKMNGASDEELKEAVGMAALTRRWSTVLNGNEMDMKQFKTEIDSIVKYVSKMMAKTKE